MTYRSRRNHVLKIFWGHSWPRGIEGRPFTSCNCGMTCARMLTARPARHPRLVYFKRDKSFKAPAQGLRARPGRGQWAGSESRAAHGAGHGAGRSIEMKVFVAERLLHKSDGAGCWPKATRLSCNLPAQNQISTAGRLRLTQPSHVPSTTSARCLQYSIDITTRSHSTIAQATCGVA